MKEIFNLKDYVEEVIRERSLTMEDGRDRGVVPVVPPVPTEGEVNGGDDGDMLG